jgi:hypothetical protein
LLVKGYESQTSNRPPEALSLENPPLLFTPPPGGFFSRDWKIDKVSV